MTDESPKKMPAKAKDSEALLDEPEDGVTPPPSSASLRHLEDSFTPSCGQNPGHSSLLKPIPQIPKDADPNASFDLEQSWGSAAQQSEDLISSPPDAKVCPPPTLQSKKRNASSIMEVDLQQAMLERLDEMWALMRLIRSDANTGQAEVREENQRNLLLVFDKLEILQQGQGEIIQGQGEIMQGQAGLSEQILANAKASGEHSLAISEQIKANGTALMAHVQTPSKQRREDKSMATPIGDRGEDKFLLLPFLQMFVPTLNLSEFPLNGDGTLQLDTDAKKKKDQDAFLAYLKEQDEATLVDSSDDESVGDESRHAACRNVRARLEFAPEPVGCSECGLTYKILSKKRGAKRPPQQVRHDLGIKCGKAALDRMVANPKEPEMQAKIVRFVSYFRDYSDYKAGRKCKCSYFSFIEALATNEESREAFVDFCKENGIPIDG